MRRTSKKSSLVCFLVLVLSTESVRSFCIHNKIQSNINLSPHFCPLKSQRTTSFKSVSKTIFSLKSTPNNEEGEKNANDLLSVASRLREEAEALERQLDIQSNPNPNTEDGEDAQKTEDTNKFLETLVGTKWELTLDIGREKGTWMPPQWGAKGTRVEVDVEVEFTFDESLGQKIIRPTKISSNYGPIKFTEGPWRIDGQFPNSTCRFSLDISEFTYDDIFLPNGKVFFSIPCWGSVLSKKRGLLSVRQRRWIIREESRMLGTFEARELESTSSF